VKITFKEILLIILTALTSLMTTMLLLSALASECRAADAARERFENRKVTSLDWSKEPVVSVVGEVGGQMLAKAGELLSQSDKPVIRILINSPGGSVVHGNIFIQAIEVAKHRGARIDCAVTNLAASMGIHILAHCDNRYVLKGGYLLFHEVRAGVQNPASPSELEAARTSMLAITEEIDIYLRKAIGASDELYNQHNIAQTLWDVDVFAKTFPNFRMTIIKDVRLPKSIEKYMFNPVGDSTFKIKFPLEVYLGM
jgi:ATP-dependent protease ClpP protease subunit